MKTKSAIKSIVAKAFLLLPLFIFTFCTSDEQIISVEGLMTTDSNLTKLLLEVASNNVNSNQAKNGNTDCTGLKYPMTFFAYYGDSPAEEITVFSDEELIEFFTTAMTPENPYYIHFPVTLVDAEGVETVIESVVALEGTLAMAIEICGGGDDENGDDDDNGGDDEYEYCDNNNKKVYICHKGITICVSVNAIWGHLNQHSEDFLGQCDN